MYKKNNSPIQKKRRCYYCVNRVEIDYKDTALLRRSVSSYGKIVSRRRSGVCSKHQREVASAIKLARVMALLPFVNK